MFEVDCWHEDCSIQSAKEDRSCGLCCVVFCNCGMFHVVFGASPEASDRAWIETEFPDRASASFQEKRKFPQHSLTKQRIPNLEYNLCNCMYSCVLLCNNPLSRITPRRCFRGDITSPMLLSSCFTAPTVLTNPLAVAETPPPNNPPLTASSRGPAEPSTGLAPAPWHCQQQLGAPLRTRA